jgi:peptidoglycan-associated lipoprotein
VSGATDVSIDHGIGTVQSSGSSRVTPIEATTYTLTANGSAGSTTATATITITAPLAPPPTEIRKPTNQYDTFDKAVAALLQDALFDYDSNNIRADAKNVLIADAEALRKIFADFPSASVNVEGHCDEKGSAEYNLGLGDRRATAARDYLVQLGVPADKLKTISYGKERPVCTESDEACWQRNRRAHFSAGQ